MSAVRKTKSINKLSIINLDDIFIDIPKTSRYFNFDKQVINPTDFLHLEQQDTVESIGKKSFNKLIYPFTATSEIYVSGCELGH